MPHGLSLVSKSITVQRPAGFLYMFWKNLENLPKIMKHVKSVTVSEDGLRSHWIVDTLGDRELEWDAKIVKDIPNKFISWKSVDDSQVDIEGFIEFIELPHGRGTEVNIRFKFNPPGAKASVLIAKVFGRDAEMEVTKDMARFKQLMESGEIASTAGQTSARDKYEA